MTQFYDLPSDDKSMTSIPFYCGVHNKNLILQYKQYLNELKQILKESNILNSPRDNRTEDATNTDNTDNNGNNENLFEKLFSSESKNPQICCLQVNEKFDIPDNILDCQDSSIRENSTINFERQQETILKLEENFENFKKMMYNNIETFKSFPPKKPNNEESFNLNFNLGCFALSPSEHNIINIENNNNFSFNFDGGHQDIFPFDKTQVAKKESKSMLKQFNEFIEADINKIRTHLSSDITVTDLRNIRDCFIKILKFYGNFEPDLQKIKEVLEKENLI